MRLSSLSPGSRRGKRSARFLPVDDLDLVEASIGVIKPAEPKSLAYAL